MALLAAKILKHFIKFFNLSAGKTCTYYYTCALVVAVVLIVSNGAFYRKWTSVVASPHLTFPDLDETLYIGSLPCQ